LKSKTKIEYETPDYGLVWINHSIRPLFEARKITKGKKVGLVEIIYGGKRQKKLVSEKDIIRWPKE